MSHSQQPGRGVQEERDMLLRTEEGDASLQRQGSSVAKACWVASAVVLAAVVVPAVFALRHGLFAAGGSAKDGLPQAVSLKTGWHKDRVATMCANVEIPEARRLSRGSSAKRRLSGAASFDPSLLFQVHLDKDHKMPYYGSADLENDVPNRAKEAILFLHGAARNAQDYFCALRETVEATLKSDMGPIMHDIEDYIILAPKYHYFADIESQNGFYNVSRKDEADELFWNTSRPYGDWRGGAAADSKSDADFNSFEVIDRMLLALSNESNFPRMKRIVVAGHSAGGQAVQRYAVVTHLRPQSLASDETLKEMKSLRPEIDLRFVVANPSSYGYLNTHRWSYTWEDKEKAWTGFTYQHYEASLGRKNWDESSGREPWGPFSKHYEPLTAKTPFICSDERFNDWTYGLNWTKPVFADLVPYVLMHPHLHRAAEFYGARDVIYLVGQNDTCSEDMLGARSVCLSSCWTRNAPKHQCSMTAMDVRCPAMLQGPNRNRRGRNYMVHLEHHFGKRVHRLYEVPGVGHQAQAMFNSEFGRMALFDSMRDQVEGVKIPA